MPSTIEKLSPTRAKLTIEVPFSDLTPAINRVYRDLSNQLAMPGFRKGHVPASLIDQRVGRGAVLSEAINAMLPEIYAKAVEEHSLMPLGQPEIDIEKLEDGEQIVLVAEVDVRPDFDVPDMSSIEVTVDAPQDLDTIVDERLEMLRERFAETSEVDRAASASDQVTIDLKGFQNGEALPDATADGITYVIGSGGMLDGLDEAVTGLKAGESTTFTSTLVGGGHEGEDAQIDVTVTKVDERTLPEIDDQFAQMVSQFDTVDEMKADLRQAAQQQGVVAQVTQARDAVLDAVLAAADFDLPEDLVEKEVEQRRTNLDDQLKAAGLSLEDYLSRMGNPDEKTEEDFMANLRTSVEKGIRAEILLSKVAEVESVSVDQEDLTNFIFQQSQENGTTPEQEIQHMQAHNHLAEWMAQIRQSKALDAIVTKAHVIDSEGNPVDVASVLTRPSSSGSQLVDISSGDED